MKGPLPLSSRTTSSPIFQRACGNVWMRKAKLPAFNSVPFVLSIFAPS